ncbi:MAG: potassium channel protein [Planctomycetota bacterium]
MAFARPTPTRRILIGLTVFSLICGGAVAGYMNEGWSVEDSIYMVVITIFGVGYGEVKPIDSTSLRILTIAVIVFGYGTAVYVVGGFIQMLVDGEFQSLFRDRKMSQGIANLNQHTIVCGFGRMGSIVAEELLEQGHPFVIIDADEARVSEAQDEGMLAMVGNATEEDVLLEAGLERAASLATLLPDDALNAFICLTGRDLAPGIDIVARGESRTAEKKLLRCGANHVVMAAAISAKRASQLITRPSAASLLQDSGSPDGINDELNLFGLQMEELHIDSQSPLAGKSLEEIDVRGNRGFLIVAVRAPGGAVNINPSCETRLSAGDVVIVVGYQDDITDLCQAGTLRRSGESEETVTGVGV